VIIAAQIVPLWLDLAAGLVMLLYVAGAAATADWPALRAAAERQHVLLGGILALLLLWLLTFQVVEEIRIHLLGVTTLTLLVGWPFILLLMFPEGFINGMLVTAFTVFYPDVVKAFYDEFYLDD